MAKCRGCGLGTFGRLCMYCLGEMLRPAIAPKPHEGKRMIIAVDPGKRMAGVAVFEDRELSSAWLSRGEEGKFRWLETANVVHEGVCARYPRGVVDLAEWVIEVPQIYTQDKLRGDPNDLLSLAFFVGALANKINDHDRITTLLPRAWGGVVPKAIKNKRAKEKLSSIERERVELPAKGYQHNVWDAVGIGLYYTRRK